ncbi:hypothetical protein cyc_02418 [Cyclospora cayetanensis]|uniref:Uncharacterized protein n=1 Tax=Cyclospora cayetanensis TaxID=88456 RepID=A0A1D3CZ12_9EIME|nr:hypothetical protein cyc_02418 [Cyclospora cayetanensis]
MSQVSQPHVAGTPRDLPFLKPAELQLYALQQQEEASQLAQASPFRQEGLLRSLQAVNWAEQHPDDFVVRQVALQQPPQQDQRGGEHLQLQALGAQQASPPQPGGLLQQQPLQPVQQPLQPVQQPLQPVQQHQVDLEALEHQASQQQTHLPLQHAAQESGGLNRLQEEAVAFHAETCLPTVYSQGFAVQQQKPLTLPVQRQLEKQPMYQGPNTVLASATSVKFDGQRAPLPLKTRSLPESTAGGLFESSSSSVPCCELPDQKRGSWKELSWEQQTTATPAPAETLQQPS